MINKEKYLLELKKVIMVMYPNGNYTKGELMNSDNKVRMAMDEYVRHNYFEYYKNKNEFQRLIAYKNRFYERCIQDL